MQTKKGVIVERTKEMAIDAIIPLGTAFLGSTVSSAHNATESTPK